MADIRKKGNEKAMPLLVSVVIICYNQAHFLGEAIQSVIEQDYSNKEIVVVNDGSLDNTRDIALSFGDSVQYIEQENSGVAVARNRGIKESTGDYICLLDSDDIYLPSFLSTLASYLEDHPDVGLVCSDAMIFNRKGDIGLRSKIVNKPMCEKNFRWETVEFIAYPSTVMFRRSCLRKTGVFEEGLSRIGSNDWLMWVKMSLHFDLAYIHRPLVKYRLHDTNASKSEQQIVLSSRKASAFVVNAPFFLEYPPHYRAKLLFFRFATAWYEGSKMVSVRYFLEAFRTNPSQLPFGLKVIRKGMARTVQRLMKQFSTVLKRAFF
jgi:glycosyltransferase involved in cell wall biosynthesis